MENKNRKNSKKGKTPQGKKSTSTVRNTSASERDKRSPDNKKRERTTQGEQVKMNIPKSSRLIHQIIPFVMYVFVLLMIICLIDWSWLGLFGRGLHYLSFGLFGYAAYGLPLILLWLAIFWGRYVDKQKSVIKIIISVALLACTSALIQVCVYSAKHIPHSLNFKEIFLAGDALRGGGILGGYLAYGSYEVFSLVGTVIIMSALIMILVMILCGVTPVYVARCIKNYVANADDRRAEKETKKAAKAARKQREADEDERENKKKRQKEDDDAYLNPAPMLFSNKIFTSEEKKERQTNLTPDPVVPERRAKRINAQNTDEDKPIPTKDMGDAKSVRDKSGTFNYDDMVDDIVNDEQESEENYPAPPDVTLMNAEESFASFDKKVSETEKQIEEEEASRAPLEDMNAIPLGIDDEADEDTGENSFPRKLTPNRTVIDDSETEDFDADSVFGENHTFVGQAKRERATGINENGDYDGLRDEEGIDADITDIVPEEVEEKKYEFPPIELLEAGKRTAALDEDALNENMNRLEDTLASFRIKIKEMSYSCGPTITRYELKPEAGIRVRSIANLVDDIAMSLATTGVRIEAPIPGKAAVGIEVPNPDPSTVYLRGLIDSQKFRDSKSKITSCLGEDVTGNPIIFDIGKMPHLLVAGATGMGKSVCINSIIVSLLYKATPEEVKLILIDPKKVEFNIYKDIPHLFSPIVSDPKKAAAALVGAVNEMEQRFALIEEVGVRDIAHYNAATANDPEKPFMPHMVIIIDELADLMMTAPDEVESSICRLAQKARAAGIHIIIGTQRPSVDVITGLIKANIPSRIAFTVASQVDSRTIIDIAGAEKLIGRGDMLYAPVGSPKPARVQGAFVSEKEVESIVEYIKTHNGPVKYNESFVANLDREAQRIGAGNKKDAGASDAAEVSGDGEDPKLRAAIELAVESGKISTSLMQRRLEVGYGRAAKLIDRMEELGFVSAADGNKPRKILITKQDLMEMTVRGNDEME